MSLIAAFQGSIAVMPQLGRGLFFGSLLAVTIAPLMLIPAVAPNQDEMPSIGLLLAVVSMGHVASTMYLFGDRGFRPMVRANWPRFIALPLTLAAAFAATAAMISAAAPWIWVGFFAWQQYHFQRQNFGIVIFAAKSRGVRPPARLSMALTLTAAAGTLGVLASGKAPNLAAIPYPSLVYCAGLAIYAAALALIIGELARQPAALRSPLVMANLITAALFLLPSFAPAGYMVIFWTYTIAHGAQYLIFMAALAWNAPGRGVAITSLFAAVFVGGVVGLQMLYGINDMAVLGLVAGHFLIDAKVWKLRGAPASSPIPERFAFVLH